MSEMTREEAVKDALETLEEMSRWPNNSAEKRALTLAIAALKGPVIDDDMVERAARAVYAWTYGEDVANHRWPHSVFANGFRNQARISLTAALGRG